MKKSYVMLAAVAALTAVAGLAQAATITIYGDGIGGSVFRQGSGGEFKVRVNSGNAGVTGTYSDTNGSVGSAIPNSFQTFCLEHNENISLGGTYNYTVDAAAVGGGVGGGPADTPSGETAWLYSAFRYGTLANYDYSAANRRSDAEQLQFAFWALEQEFGGAGAGGGLAGVLAVLTDGSKAEAWVTAAFGASAADKTNASAVVRVLNLTDNNNTLCQSQLTMIPLPSATGLAGFGLFAVAARRRRLASI